MKTKRTNSLMQNIIRVALGTAFILLIPFLAMQFTGEVVWDLADFAVAGALLFGTGLTYELVARKVDKRYRHKVISPPAHEMLTIADTS